MLVLDEADRMLDEQFTEQMKEIIRLCARNRQTMLFSATMTDQVGRRKRKYDHKNLGLFISSGGGPCEFVAEPASETIHK